MNEKLSNLIDYIRGGCIKHGGVLDSIKNSYSEIKIEKNNNLYLSIAYRYGFNTIENYVVYIGSDKDKAIERSKLESEFRGGKYGIKIYSFLRDGDEDTKEEITYIPSINKEDDLIIDNNEYIDSKIGFEFRLMIENDKEIDVEVLKERFEYFSKLYNKK